MRRKARTVALTAVLALGFLCAVGMAATLVITYIAPYVDGVDV